LMCNTARNAFAEVVQALQRQFPGICTSGFFTGWFWFLVLARVDRRGNSLEEQLASHRFAQVGRATGLLGFCADLRLIVSGDKNDWGGSPLASEVPAQIEPRHAPQVDVEHQTIGESLCGVLQERLGGSVDPRFKPCGAQETPDRSRETVVVIHDCHAGYVFVHASLFDVPSLARRLTQGGEGGILSFGAVRETKVQ
jgi:hypothetical protein